MCTKFLFFMLYIEIYDKMIIIIKVIIALHTMNWVHLVEYHLVERATWSKYTFLNLFISVWGHFVENYNY
jgi:hypothetical protein